MCLHALFDVYCIAQMVKIGQPWRPVGEVKKQKKKKKKVTKVIFHACAETTFSLLPAILHFSRVYLPLNSPVFLTEPKISVFHIPRSQHVSDQLNFSSLCTVYISLPCFNFHSSLCFVFLLCFYFVIQLLWLLLNKHLLLHSRLSVLWLVKADIA